MTMALKEILNCFDMRKLENGESFQCLSEILRKDKWYKPLLDYTEEQFQFNRVYTVAGFASILLASLVYQFGLHLIIGAVGFLYPAYQTIRCLENFDVNEGRKWLTYWLVFSAFNFLEIFLFFLNWLPGYWCFKCLFYIWCYAPNQMNGSYVIYNGLICPFLNQDAINATLDRFKKTALTICSDPHIDNVTNPAAVNAHAD